MCAIFFFSSRRRHTRYWRDWSSDVCSSDLGSEGTFNLCSFLYVDALARAGQLDKARYAFDKMLTYANHVGLFGEEIGPTGEQLGNFPQAFTHLSLIFAATTLGGELERRTQRGTRPHGRPW